MSQLKRIIAEIISELNAKDLKYISKKAAYPELLKRGSDKDAIKAFVRAWVAQGKWSPKAESLLKLAFPNAKFYENLGLGIGKSGDCAIEISTNDLIIFKHSIGIKSRESGYMYNRSQGWVIPPQ